MIPFIILIAFIVTIFSEYSIVKNYFKDDCISIQIVICFIIGMLKLLVPLYLTGLLFEHGFTLVSWAILLISLIQILKEIVKHSLNLRYEIVKLSKFLKRSLSNNTLLDYIFASTIILFIFKYSYILLLKAIIDWDAISLYLPFARRIYEVDHIPLRAYDYEPMIRPPGISILYAWTYSLSLSNYTENFRLIPLFFVLMIMVVIYVLGREFASIRIAKISTIIYMLLPFHEYFLYCGSHLADLPFYSLIISSIFFTYKYLEKRKNRYLLLASLAYSLSGLFKAQFEYYILIPLLTFTSLFRSMWILLFIIFSSTLILSLLSFFFIYGDKTFFLNLDLTSKILGMSFILLLTTICCVIMNKLRKGIFPEEARGTIKIMFTFYSLGLLFPSIWIFRNYIYFKTFIWVSEIKIPNYEWALEILGIGPAPTSPVQGCIGSFLLYVSTWLFLSCHSGTFWIVPKLIGIMDQLKVNKKISILFVWLIGYWIGFFLSRFHHFEVFGPNPRDADFFAFICTIFSAIGLEKISKYFSKDKQDTIITYLVLFLGITVLSQSLMIYHYGPLSLVKLVDHVASLFSLSICHLTESFPIRHYIFWVITLPKLVTMILVYNLLLFSPLLFKKCLIYKIQVRIRIKRIISSKTKAILKIILLSILFSSFLVFPYILLTYEFGGGNIFTFNEKQLEVWGGVVTEVMPKLDLKDNDTVIISDISRFGLQYFAPKHIYIIDLSIPANLAHFKPLFTSCNISEILNILFEHNVHYFIISPWSTWFEERLLKNSTFSHLINNPEYFRYMGLSGWKIYEFIKGRYFIVKGWEDSSFTENWEYVESLSTKGANYSFTSDGDVLSVSVAGNATVVFRYFGLPAINTTEYPYIVCRVKGSPNARWLFRLISQDKKVGYDFPYWWKPSENWETYVFYIAETPLKDKLLAREAFLAVKSIDSNPAILYIDFYFIYQYTNSTRNN